jgi:2-alkyl-3-oxoalkanoate reductase
MRIFIAGATGAIGKQMIKFILKEGDEVHAMIHSKEAELSLAEQGVKTVFADALDEKAVLDGMIRVKPEIVINMLTALPKTYTPETMKAAASKDLQIRRQGGANLQAAARAANAKRYIIQSSAYWYMPGEGLANEDTPFAYESPSSIACGTRMHADLEQHLFEAEDLEGVILRYGFFYGPDTWFAKDGSLADQVRKQNFPLVEGGHGKWNFVHVEDAAKATIASFKSPPGIYNINDDNPSEMSVWLSAYAHWLEAPPPSVVSQQHYLETRGPDSLYYATCLRGASNDKAKKLLGFKPRHLEWLPL